LIDCFERLRNRGLDDTDEKNYDELADTFILEDLNETNNKGDKLPFLS